MLQKQLTRLSKFRDDFHVCLLGIGDLSRVPQIVDIEDESNLDIDEFHERILKYLIEEMVRKGFKYVSYARGGFQEAHDLALASSFTIDGHSDSSCFHCLRGEGTLQ